MSKIQYSILIIVIDGEEGHIAKIVRKLKETNPLAEISLCTNFAIEQLPEDIRPYLVELIRVTKHYSGKLSRIKSLRQFMDILCVVKQFRQLSKRRHYDIVNIHFAQYYLLFAIPFLRRMCNNLVLRPWGSDVLRLRGQKKKRMLAELYRRSDYIITGIEDNLGRTLACEMHVDPARFVPLGWGSEEIDYINEHLQYMSREDAKREMGLAGQYVIACGYNAFEGQRHETMIRALAAKKDQLPENYVLQFPVNYGFSEKRKSEYVRRLKSLCAELGVKSVFSEDYLGVADLFVLRRTADMFIHVQPTDEGNVSLQEYLLCGAKIVHGDWVKYSYFEKYKPLCYYPVYELEKVGDAVVDAIRSPKINVNPDLLLECSRKGWNPVMRRWDEFFMSIA